MSDNPLMQFARHAELTVKLASPKSWYPEGFIQYTLNDEVEVYPMLPKDELMLYNPDALISGQAMVNLIKSCCPSVLDPSKLYFPDANILLLAIKRATYGEDHKQTHRCPKCEEKVKLMNETDPEGLAKLIKEGKVMDHEEEFIFNIDSLLVNVKSAEEEYSCKIDGLTFYFQPLAMGAKEQFSLISAKRNKLLKMYVEMLEKNEDITQEEKNMLTSEISNIQIEMINSNNNIITSCIKEIKLPDDSIVSDKELIKEFINNATVQMMNELNTQIRKINDIGLPQTLSIQCSACGHEWEVPFEGFNQSDFFG